jgi:hypothetical protein
VEHQLTFPQIINGLSGPLRSRHSTFGVELLNRQLLDYFGKSVDELKGWARETPFILTSSPHSSPHGRQSLDRRESYALQHMPRRPRGRT